MPSQLTEAHRRQQLALRAVTLQELQRLWPTLNVRDLDTTYPGWAAAVARLTRDHHGISAAIAARYLRAARAQAGAPGQPVIIPAPALPAEQIDTSLRVTTVAALKTATSRGTPLAAAAQAAFVNSAGAATRLVLNGGRNTIQASVAADPAARGWRRVTSGRTCGFCQMLAGRGAVYSAATADFQSHDHCGCAAEPVWA